MDNMFDHRKVIDAKPAIDHSQCHNDTCRRGVICPTCSAFTWTVATKGRWDPVRKATALPYDVVWVKFSCGCIFGDISSSLP